MDTFAHITIAETLERMSNTELCIVDIRDPQSFIAGHIPGSLHLTNESLSQFITESDFSQPVVVCCYHGNSSQQAAQYLIHQGFEEVYSLDGGFELWRQTEAAESGEWGIDAAVVMQHQLISL